MMGNDMAADQVHVRDCTGRFLYFVFRMVFKELTAELIWFPK